MNSPAVFLAALFAVLVSTSGWTCEVATKEIVFPGMGSHVAYYCKATDAEKKQALGAVRKHSCIPKKLAEFGKPVLIAEALDVVPYWFTKPDAEKAGPLLDCRLTLTQNNENGNERRMGFRALASGRKIVALPTPRQNPQPNTPPPAPVVLGIQFEVTEPTVFQRDCPATGCTERFKDLCDP